MTDLFIKSLIGFFAVLGSGFAGWLFKRGTTKAEIAKKNAEIEKMQAEVKMTRTESNQAIMDQYQEALDDLKNRYDERYKYLAEVFSRRHEDLKADYERKYIALKEEKDAEIKQLVRKVKNLSTSLEYWKKKYKEMEK